MMHLKNSLQHVLSNTFNLRINEADLEKLIFDTRFISSFSIQDLELIEEDTRSTKFVMSSFIHALYYRPKELANSTYLNKVCEKYNLFNAIGADRFRTALNNGKEREVLNYIYNDLPKKVIQASIDYFDNEDVKDFYSNKLIHFAKPLDKKIRDITEACLFMEMLEGIRAYNEHHCAPQATISDISHEISFSLLYSKTDQQFLVQAEIAKNTFHHQRERYAYWQSYFSIKNGEIFADTGDEQFDNALNTVFNFKDFTADEKISFYEAMVVDDNEYESLTTEIYHDYTSELLKIVKDAYNDRNKRTVYQICAAYINDYLADKKYQQAMELIDNQTFRELAVVFNKDIDMEKLFEYNDFDLYKFFFSNKYLNCSCTTYFDNDCIKDELEIYMEQKRLEALLEHF